jgi:3-oxoacyl-[acyl-carrier protein] reductase
MSDTIEFKDQVALVTGGARGIGKSICVRLAREGVNIAVADVMLDAAEETAKELEAMGVKAMAVEMNVSDSASVQAAIKKVASDMGRIDILINNAGITRDGLIMRMKEDDWDAVLNINLKSVFLCSKEIFRTMSKQRYGRIVNIASVVAFMGNAGQANYSASKAGMMGLTKTTAREYSSRGITVNAVAPGFIITVMTDQLPEDVKQAMMANIPLGEFGTADDVAEAVCFLASPGAKYITGQVIHVNGGMYM